MVLSGISTPFGELFRTPGQITHVLRTRAPLYSPLRAFSLDLHVLGTPPAFVLSQDQTLQFRDFDPCPTSCEVRGMVYCDVANSRNAVTAFVVCLLFSFQRPSFTLGIEISSRTRSLSMTEVAKATVLRQEGECIYCRSPASSRLSSSRSSPSVQTFGDRTSTSGPRPVSRGLCRIASALRYPSRVGAASTPTQRAASRGKPRRSCRLPLD